MEYGVTLQKIFSELANFMSNDAECFLHKVLGISKLKYCWQVLTTSISLVLKSFMKKRLTTKSRDNKSGAKSTILNQLIARSASAEIPSKKSSITTNRKSPMRFPMSLIWSSYMARKFPKGGLNRKTPVFPLKSHFTWRKSATKCTRVKTVSGKVVGHSLA